MAKYEPQQFFDPAGFNEHALTVMTGFLDGELQELADRTERVGRAVVFLDARGSEIPTSMEECTGAVLYAAGEPIGWEGFMTGVNDMRTASLVNPLISDALFRYGLANLHGIVTDRANTEVLYTLTDDLMSIAPTPTELDTGGQPGLPK